MSNLNLSPAKSLESLIFQSRSYVDILHILLSGQLKRSARKPRGSIQRFSVHLKCHTSFVAQVLSGRSHLSVDQAILAADYFSLSLRAKEHFLDLLLLERSGVMGARDFFKKRMEKRKNEMQDLSKRWETQTDLSAQESWEFYSSWLHQTVYSLIHISRFQDIKKLAVVLGISLQQLRKIVLMLTKMKLVSTDQKTVKPLKNWLHLSRESPVICVHHQSWRLRAMQELDHGMAADGLHYSGAITVSAADGEEIKQDLLRLLDRIRQRVSASESEKSYAINLDFFSLISNLRQNKT